MYVKIGETRLLVGQYKDREIEKLELTFEYLFDSYSNYRRFAQVIADLDGKSLKIKLKSEFKNPSDCAKLSRLLIGVQKLVTPKNLRSINQILESGNLTPQDFVNQQQDSLEYFS